MHTHAQSARHNLPYPSSLHPPRVVIVPRQHNHQHHHHRDNSKMRRRHRVTDTDATTHPTPPHFHYPADDANFRCEIPSAQPLPPSTPQLSFISFAKSCALRSFHHWVQRSVHITTSIFNKQEHQRGSRLLLRLWFFYLVMFSYCSVNFTN